MWMATREHLVFVGPSLNLLVQQKVNKEKVERHRERGQEGETVTHRKWDSRLVSSGFLAPIHWWPDQRYVEKKKKVTAGKSSDWTTRQTFVWDFFSSINRLSFHRRRCRLPISLNHLELWLRSASVVVWAGNGSVRLWRSCAIFCGNKNVLTFSFCQSWLVAKCGHRIRSCQLFSTTDTYRRRRERGSNSAISLFFGGFLFESISKWSDVHLSSVWWWWINVQIEDGMSCKSVKQLHLDYKEEVVVEDSPKWNQ